MVIYDLIMDAHQGSVQEAFAVARSIAALTSHTVIMRGNTLSVAVAPGMTGAMCEAAYDRALAVRDVAQ